MFTYMKMLSKTLKDQKNNNVRSMFSPFMRLGICPDTQRLEKFLHALVRQSYFLLNNYLLEVRKICMRRAFYPI